MTKTEDACDHKGSIRHKETWWTDGYTTYFTAECTNCGYTKDMTFNKIKEPNHG